MIQLPNTTGTGVNCGSASLYSITAFSLACNIKRLGTGTTVSTGTGGHTLIEPIFTGGVGESETLGLNCAWFLGWIPANSKIGLDFEDNNNGMNHPITSSAALTNSIDYHLVATYNPTSSLNNTGSWKFYINGVLDRSFNITGSTLAIRTPETASKQAVGIGVAINSSATRTGAFLGQITEVAIWNTTLDPASVELLGKSKIKGMPLQISSSALQGYWPLDYTSDGATVSTTAGAIIDRSGRNRNGTAFGTITGRAEIKFSYP